MEILVHVRDFRVEAQTDTVSERGERGVSILKNNQRPNRKVTNKGLYVRFCIKAKSIDEDMNMICIV